MRKVFINRTRSGPQGTFGELRIDEPKSDHPICYTVELPWLDNHPQTSCIPTGIYIFSQYNSPKHGLVWMTDDVPKRQYIQMHPANWPSDLLGCIGVGQDYVDNLGGKGPGVTHSQDTFKALKSMLPPIIEVTITEHLV